MNANTLLPFQTEILQSVHDPSTSELTLLARGLGLRTILCTLLKIYDSPTNLVLIVNAHAEEELAIGEMLGVMGCRKPGLRIVGYGTGRRDRQDLYKRGGLFSATSQILVVDMLQADIPMELITGLVVLHAERVTALSLEAFIIRLFREKNTTGFVKAFSDQPEAITNGLYPLKSILKELQIRSVNIFPRFHASIKASLERRRADVVELYQPLSESMSDIHTALGQCVAATLAELKRSNKELDLDDLTPESTYFRSFDVTVRKMLDPVWHRVGPKTKQLVGDLSVLRNLMNYLLSYDALAFHVYLETIIASNSTSISGAPKQHRSPWLFTDAANVVFKVAKRRCYVITDPSGKINFNTSNTGLSISRDTTPSPAGVIDVDDEDAWAVLDEFESSAGPSSSSRKEDKPQKPKRPEWLPNGLEPVLEELPKWSLLADVLQEIEEEMIRVESTGGFHVSAPGTNTTLIMVSSPRTADLLRDYLRSRNPKLPRTEQGRKMMERRLRGYLWWKGRLNTEDKSKSKTKNSTSSALSSKTPLGTSSNKSSGITADGISEALRRKDALKVQRGINRRRTRGGSTSASRANSIAPEGSTPAPASNNPEPSVETPDAGGMSSKEREKFGILSGEGEMRLESDNIADFLAAQQLEMIPFEEDDLVDAVMAATSDVQTSDLNANINLDDAYFGLLEPQDTILIRTYSDDSDDTILDEISPRFIVMYEPNSDFVRRIECYRSANQGLAVRVYFIVYHLSSEEHKYLVGLRREKEAFEKLIKERATMVLTIGEDFARVGPSEQIIKTISTRIAGGREINSEPSQVVVDIREFRSSLPSLLHASWLRVIPVTLTVGDYILTPEICVERKSIPDLMSSFNSGRLYTQCEMMSIHYKQPVLLIEFEEHKSFSLESTNEVKSYVKPKGKCPVKKPGTSDSQNDELTATSIQAKLVLLTLSFPRLRIIWSSSPFASAEIFNDLKMNNAEPDPAHTITVGLEDSGQDELAEAGYNAAGEELLRCLPGITAKNVRYVMGKVGSVKEFCSLSLAEVKEILGSEPGKACWEFMHRGEKFK